jgi:hypothetical protein
MKNNLTYAITVCNEFHELRKLIDLLLKKKRDQDNIIVLCDITKASEDVIMYLKVHNNEYSGVTAFFDKFDNHFANWKNKLSDLCLTDYIFQIDADELPHEDLIEMLPHIIDQDPDVVLIPRHNIVNGITPEHIQKWGWKQDELGRINWPDLQWRLYRKDKRIQWVNKVHERLEGHRTISALPGNYSLGKLFLYHIKDIDKQEKQNSYYETL